VLVNILDNAIKHTPDETPIHLHVFPEGKNAVFEVADKGLGLVPESIPFLFQRNHQKQMSTDSQKGSGLGLFICKSIVEAHGGTLSAHNEPTGGAVFRFTIPLEG